jgi:hypothetical protein
VTADPSKSLGDVLPDVGLAHLLAAVRRHRDPRDQQRTRPDQHRHPDDRESRPDREQGRTDRGTRQLVDGDEPGLEPRIRNGEVVARHEHREQGVRGVVGEHLGRAEHEERNQHEADGHRPGDDRRRDHREHHRPDDVHDDDEQPTVEPIGQRAGVEAEQELRQPLEKRREGHQPGVTRLGRDEQRPGRDADAVTQVRAPGRAEQPAEPVAQACRGDGFDHSRHERGV